MRAKVQRGQALWHALPACGLALLVLAAASVTADQGYFGFGALNGGITGGIGGPVVTATTGAELQQYLDTLGPLIIQISGMVSIDGMQGTRPNKTIIGLGSDATVVGGGIYMYRSNNIVIRNITFLDSSEDAIGMTNETKNVWVDHCTLRNAADGLIDIVRQSNFVTISYCLFENQVKTMLFGHSDAASSDTGFLKITVHHNWFNGTESRHPRVRFGQVHVLNNYYTNNVTYGVASTEEADVLVEGNYFSNVQFPCLVGYAESGPGDLVERNNIYANSGVPQTRGLAFEPNTSYPYSVDPPSQIPSFVTASAGAGKLPPIDIWRTIYFTPGELINLSISGDFADREGDGAGTVAEFAFNLNPKLNDAKPLVHGAGVAGMPLIRLDASRQRLTIEYVRRKASTLPGIMYIAQFSNDLNESNGWTATGAESVSSIDATWERVVVTDSQTIGAGPRRFGRVKLVLQAAL